MVERIRCYKELNNQIFGILNKHLANREVLAKPIREYQPPIYQLWVAMVTSAVVHSGLEIRNLIGSPLSSHYTQFKFYDVGWDF